MIINQMYNLSSQKPMSNFHIPPLELPFSSANPNRAMGIDLRNACMNSCSQNSKDQGQSPKSKMELQPLQFIRFLMRETYSHRSAAEQMLDNNTQFARIEKFKLKKWTCDLFS